MNLLLLRHSAGYEHSYLPHAEVTIKEIGATSGLYTAHTTHQCEVITAENLANYDIVAFATTGELPLDDAQKQALLDFVRNGKAFFGIHNATDTCYEWPEYGAMLGAYFNGHPWHHEVVVKVEDTAHPAVRHLGESFSVTDEIYTMKDFDRSKTHVFMSIENSSVDLEKSTRADRDHALGWCHSYGEGRVIYSGLGHPDELWSEPWFHEHILGCIKWAAGIEG